MRSYSYRNSVVFAFLLFLLPILFITVEISGAFPSVGIDDNFTGDADPAGGIWTTGISGGAIGCRKSGGVLIKQAGTPGDGCYTTATVGTTDDQEIYATLPNVTNHGDTFDFRILFCATDLGTVTLDGYALEVRKVTGAADELSFARFTNSVTPVVLGAVFNQEVTNGDAIGAERIAPNTLNFWYKPAAGAWSLLFTRTDATYTCANTRAAIDMVANSVQVDDFGVGDIVAAATSSRRRYFQVIEFK